MRVAIGMSGGVDSSVSALIMKERGYEVIGITLRFHKEVCDSLRVCCSPKDVQDAVKVSQRLGIPHLTIDWEKLFEERVIKNFVEEHRKGKTPNPCAVCNREVKTGFLARYLREVALIDKLATGHYARIVDYKDRKLIARAKDKKRDQSYFMALLRQEDIELLEFPLGDMTKEEVRALASKYGLETAQKPDSQDVCFLMGEDVGSFLARRLGSAEGSFIYKGKVVGKHDGFYRYTIGQRKGLGVALGKPVYVVGIDAEKNLVYLGDEEDLQRDWLILREINFHLPPEMWDRPTAQIRYRNATFKVKDVERLEDGRYKVVFEEKVKGITPGQVCAFYEDDVLIAGGVIEE
ncbi:tRNA 2-thiouridine(34) synthase MnmA [Thermocrinis sp.]